jgi:hypothetical protein
MGILHKFSALLFLLSMLMLNALNEYNDTKEGAYIPFSLSKVKLSNLQLIPIYSIKSNKCLSYLRTRAYLLKVLLQYKCASLHQLINAWRNNYQGKIQKEVCWLVQLSFSPRAGSLDEVWMLLHHTPRLKRFHGLLSMSSCTV